MAIETEHSVEFEIPSVRVYDDLDFVEDSNLDIGISTKVLHRIGAHDGRFAVLAHGLTSRVVRLVASELTDEEDENDRVYISPKLALLFDRSLLRKPILKQCSRKTGILSLLSENEERRAERVVLKRIGLPRREYRITISSQNEDDIIHESLESLKRYFSLSQK